MDESEIRIAALETLLIELLAWLPADAIDDTMASLKAGLANASDGDERTIRQGAIGLIEDAQQRFRGYRP
ncbi:hypothetical protein BH11PSE2_BH11PSE2_19670 [soil metagenome]